MISPRATVKAIGDRFLFDAEYRPELLWYANEGATRALHFYDAGGTAEFIKRTLFVEARSTQTEKIYSLLGPVTDSSINFVGNRTTVRSSFVSPYALYEFGPYADGRARITYSALDSDATFIDSHATTVDLTLASGPTYKLLKWNVALFKENIDYDDPRRTTSKHSASRRSQTADHADDRSRRQRRLRGQQLSDHRAGAARRDLECRRRMESHGAHTSGRDRGPPLLRPYPRLRLQPPDAPDRLECELHRGCLHRAFGVPHTQRRADRRLPRCALHFDPSRSRGAPERGQCVHRAQCPVAELLERGQLLLDRPVRAQAPASVVRHPRRPEHRAGEGLPRITRCAGPRSDGRHRFRL